MADHLITRANGSPLKIEVPFVCKEICALGCFSTYSTTRGFEYNRHGYLIIRDDQRSEFPSLLQEWLYFGLLQEFLDKSIEISDFVRNHTNNGQVLDTSPLLTHMDNWHRRHLRNTLNRFVADRAYRSIEIAANQCRFLEGASVSADCEVLPTIFLSIHFLIDSLVIVAADRLVDMPTDFENLQSLDYHTKDWRYPLSNELEYAPPSSGILLNHMVQNKWCIHQARWFCENFTYNVLFYLASFARTTSRGDHSGCEGEDHCIANNVDFQTYQCQHVNEECGCEFVSISSSAVKLIIRNGRIPLVSFTQTPSGDLHREVIEAKFSSKYVAISHVWKDGLGNPRGNALPRCQNRRQSLDIFRFWRGKALEPPVSVWMDTLCIPVDDDDLRMKAIKRMTPTYKSAEKVMVIDSSLSDTFDENASTEFCADILISAWNGRSWTLQEGALAEELCFPASVCSVTPSSTSKNIFGFCVDLVKLLIRNRNHAPCRLSPPPNASIAASYIHRQLHEAHQLPSVGRLGKFTDAEDIVYGRLHNWGENRWHFDPQLYPRLDPRIDPRQHQFTDVWNALLGRTTTMIEDLHGIIANLLDFNAEEILALHQSQRMKALLCAQDTLPTKLLYDYSPRTFAEDPLDRWLPDIPKGTVITPTDDWMQVTKQGLLIESNHCLDQSIIIKHDAMTSRVGSYRLLLNDLDPINVTCHNISSCSYPKQAHHTTLLHLAPRWQFLLLSGLTVRGASFTVESTGSESFRVYYDEPVDLRMHNEGSRDSTTLSNLPILHGEVVSEAKSISIDIGIHTAYKPLHRRKADSGKNYFLSRYISWVVIFIILTISLPLVLLLFGLTTWYQPGFTSSRTPNILMFCLIPLTPLIFFLCNCFYVRWSQAKYRAWLQSYGKL